MTSRVKVQTTTKSSIEQQASNRVFAFCFKIRIFHFRSIPIDTSQFNFFSQFCSPNIFGETSNSCGRNTNNSYNNNSCGNNNNSYNIYNNNWTANEEFPDMNFLLFFLQQQSAVGLFRAFYAEGLTLKHKNCQISRSINQLLAGSSQIQL